MNYKPEKIDRRLFATLSQNASTLVRNNKKTEARKKYSDFLKDYSIDHSDTSSQCSFPNAIEEDPFLNRNDNEYSIKIERLFPKELRRKRYHNVSKNVEAERTKVLAAIKKNPQEYIHRKGIRTFLMSQFDRSEARKEERKQKKKESLIQAEPWRHFVHIPDDTPLIEKERIIRMKYLEIINSPTFTDDTFENGRIIDFIQYYRKYSEEVLRKEESYEQKKNKYLRKLQEQMAEELSDD